MRSVEIKYDGAWWVEEPRVSWSAAEPRVELASLEASSLGRLALLDLTVSFIRDICHTFIVLLKCHLIATYFFK